MLLSEILKTMPNAPDAYLINEQPFSALGLLEGESPDELCSFMSDYKYISYMGNNVSMLITTKNIADKMSNLSCGLCVTTDPQLFFFYLHNYLSNCESYTRKKEKSVIGDNCNISPLASIASNNVIIGNNVTIEEFVIIRENTKIGNGSVIRAGTVIGGVGFEHKRDNDSIFTVSHVGGVIIGSNVEIQYNTCVDRGIYPWSDTLIDDYCRIDNLVHVAHGVKLAPRVMVVANSVLGGRLVVGEDSWIGLGATIRNGITIGKNARANMGAVVSRDIPAGEAVTGNFAIPHNKFMENLKK